MAFRKSVEQQPILEKVVNVSEYEELSIPLVLTKEDGMYHGFVPGFVMNDIVLEDKEQCADQLKVYAKDYLARLEKSDLPYPRFPSNEEIKVDFKKVVYIKRLNTKAKRKY